MASHTTKPKSKQTKDQKQELEDTDIRAPEPEQGRSLDKGNPSGTQSGQSSNITKDLALDVGTIAQDSEIMELIRKKGLLKKAQSEDPAIMSQTTISKGIEKSSETTTNTIQTLEQASSSVLDLRKKAESLGVATFTKTTFNPVFITDPPKAFDVPSTFSSTNWFTKKVKISGSDPTVSSIVPAFIQAPVTLEDETLSLKLQEECVDHILIEDVTQIKSNSDQVFNSSTAYVICVPNPEFIASTGITLSCGVPIAKSVFKSFSSVFVQPVNGIDRLVVASGALAWALNFARRTDVVLKYMKSGDGKGNVITLHSNFVPTNPLSNVLSQKLMMPMYPSIVLASISRRLPFLPAVIDEILEDVPYHVGEQRSIRRCNRIQKDLIVTQALNIDTPTAMALNRTARVYIQEDFNQDIAEPALSAYSMSDVRTTVMNSWEQLKFGRTLTTDYELSGLLVAAAGTKSLFGAILTLNEEAFLRMGTVSPRLTTPTLDDIPANRLDTTLLDLVKTRLSESSFQDAIQTILMQVTPQLIFPTVLPEVHRVKHVKLIISLFEILMLFNIVPGVAKLAGAGLARTLRSIIGLLWGVELRIFLEACGWSDNQPGSTLDPTDVEYWSNAHTPTIYLPDINIPANCRAITAIHNLLRPLVVPHPHDKALEARFPRLYREPVTYLPYPSVPVMGAETSPFKLRINEIVEKCKEWVETTNVTAEKSFKAKAAYLFDAISGALDSHGLGMSREVGAILRWMVNRKTFFVDFYDGELGTAFPPQMVLVARDQLSYPQKVEVERRLHRELVIRPQMIWSVIFHFDFKGAHYDPTLHDDNNCSFNPPIPGDHLAADNALVEASVRLLEPFALTNMIISDDLNVAGVEVLRDLVGRDRLTSGDYGSIRRFVTQSLEGVTFETDYVRFEGLETIHATWKIPNPCLRYLNPLGQVLQPRNYDPAVMIHGLSMIREDFLNRFNIGIEAILSPRSAYSRLRRGIIIHRNTLSLDNPYLQEPEAFLPIENEYDRRAHTVQAHAQHGKYIVYANDGIQYEEPSEYPQRTFILRDMSRLDSRDIKILWDGILAGRFRVELPNAYYIFEIKHCSRKAATNQSDDVMKLLTMSEKEIPQITFYDTELPSYIFSPAMIQSGKIARYLYPMQSITDHVISRGLFCDDTVPDPRYWKDPPPHLCDTGTVSDFGILAYANRTPKTLDSICFSNQVIVMGQETDFSGEVYYDEKVVKYLDD
ncbi:structural protein P2 [Grapevine Cabernet Sauvignon reovirus]|uniref:structural protein P2 n=1 Tax=Grapevine Cabernet Sauvignon reovirus TaxID=1640277 RepID=UPI0006A754A1|nr:structural protein P2 [Grapevine Cabernet Sauvignon reovirus]AKZ17732.1 structural protein P2 [Grapevine Cabernet Sauvignon reovirus]